ncbi:hypothetical protein F5Y19DRAFT_430203 [Xylariaceae sp. FL1651]|nr:hypothetical protein F5Y19DRAFT_430203 [Xylariaceae sp. FL1651]
MASEEKLSRMSGKGKDKSLSISSKDTLGVKVNDFDGDTPGLVLMDVSLIEEVGGILSEDGPNEDLAIELCATDTSLVETAVENTPETARGYEETQDDRLTIASKIHDMHPEYMPLPADNSENYDVERERDQPALADTLVAAHHETPEERAKIPDVMGTTPLDLEAAAAESLDGSNYASTRDIKLEDEMLPKDPREYATITHPPIGDLLAALPDRELVTELQVPDNEDPILQDESTPDLIPNDQQSPVSAAQSTANDSHDNQSEGNSEAIQWFESPMMESSTIVARNADGSALKNTTEPALPDEDFNKESALLTEIGLLPIAHTPIELSQHVAQLESSTEFTGKPPLQSTPLDIIAGDDTPVLTSKPEPEEQQYAAEDFAAGSEFEPEQASGALQFETEEDCSVQLKDELPTTMSISEETASLQDPVTKELRRENSDYGDGDGDSQASKVVDSTTRTPVIEEILMVSGNDVVKETVDITQYPDFVKEKLVIAEEPIAAQGYNISEPAATQEAATSEEFVIIGEPTIAKEEAITEEPVAVPGSIIEDVDTAHATKVPAYMEKPAIAEDPTLAGNLLSEEERVIDEEPALQGQFTIPEEPLTHKEIFVHRGVPPIRKRPHSPAESQPELFIESEAPEIEISVDSFLKDVIDTEHLEEEPNILEHRASCDAGETEDMLEPKTEHANQTYIESEPLVIDITEAAPAVTDSTVIPTVKIAHAVEAQKRYSEHFDRGKSMTEARIEAGQNIEDRLQGSTPLSQSTNKPEQWSTRPLLDEEHAGAIGAASIFVEALAAELPQDQAWENAVASDNRLSIIGSSEVQETSLDPEQVNFKANQSNETGDTMKEALKDLSEELSNALSDVEASASRTSSPDAVGDLTKRDVLAYSPTQLEETADQDLHTTVDSPTLASADMKAGGFEAGNDWNRNDPIAGGIAGAATTVAGGALLAQSFPPESTAHTEAWSSLRSLQGSSSNVLTGTGQVFEGLTGAPNLPSKHSKPESKWNLPSAGMKALSGQPEIHTTELQRQQTEESTALKAALTSPQTTRGAATLVYIGTKDQESTAPFQETNLEEDYMHRATQPYWTPSAPLDSSEHIPSDLAQIEKPLAPLERPIPPKSSRRAHRPSLVHSSTQTDDEDFVHEQSFDSHEPDIYKFTFKETRSVTPGIVLPDLNDSNVKALGRARSLKKKRRQNLRQAEETVAAAVVIYAAARELSPPPKLRSGDSQVGNVAGIFSTNEEPGQMSSDVVSLGVAGEHSVDPNDVSLTVADLSTDDEGKDRHHRHRHHRHHHHHSSRSIDSKSSDEHHHHHHRRRRSREESNLSTGTSSARSIPSTSGRHDSGVDSSYSSSRRRYRTPEEQADHDKRKEERRAAREAREKEREGKGKEAEPPSSDRHSHRSSRRSSQSILERRMSIKDEPSPISSKKFFDFKGVESKLTPNYVPSSPKTPTSKGLPAKESPKPETKESPKPEAPKRSSTSASKSQSHSHRKSADVSRSMSTRHHDESYDSSAKRHRERSSRSKPEDDPKSSSSSHSKSHHDAKDDHRHSRREHDAKDDHKHSRREERQKARDAEAAKKKREAPGGIRAAIKKLFT